MYLVQAKSDIYYKQDPVSFLAAVQILALRGVSDGAFSLSCADISIDKEPEAFPYMRP